jgi:hypothetical protein
MLSELWSLYSEFPATQRDSVSVSPFPISGEEALETLPSERLNRVRANQHKLEYGGVWHGTAISNNARDTPSWPAVQSLRLDRAMSERILSASAQAGIGIFATIAGAILSGERLGFGDIETGDRIPLGVMTMVDLRTRMVPPLEPTAVTNFVAPSFQVVEIARDDELATIGRSLTRAVDEDIAHGRCIEALIHAMSEERTAQGHPPIVLSNLGRIPDLCLPRTLTASDIRPRLWFDSSGLGDSGPEDGRPAPLASTYQISSYGGRIGVEMINLPGTIHPDVQHMIATAIEQKLHSWANRACDPTPGPDSPPDTRGFTKESAHA